MLSRKSDWQTQLDCFLRHNAQQRFVYGSWDCCLFVCDAIHVMTGIDPASQFRDCYKTRSEAYRAIRAITGRGSVRAAVEHVTESLQMKEAASVLVAHRGDIVLIKRGRDFSLGLVALNGRHAIVASADGLSYIPLTRAARAWHV